MNAMNAVASDPLLESQGIPLIEGDVVRKLDSAKYISSFSKRVADCYAVVLWVGPTKLDMFHDQACVKFFEAQRTRQGGSGGVAFERPSASAGAFRLRGLTFKLTCTLRWADFGLGFRAQNWPAAKCPVERLVRPRPG